MSTSIVFNDGSSTTLTNGKAVPGDRFSNWVPDSAPIGDPADAQATGGITFFLLRTDHGARFELPHIPNRRTAGVSPMSVAARLILHLLKGGQCTVNTGDVTSASYTCSLRPGTRPTLNFTNRRAIEYTLSLDLINAAGSPTAMVCHYAEM